MKMRKLLSAVIAGAMLLASMSISVFADDATITNVEALKTAIENAENGGTVTIDTDLADIGDITISKSLTITSEEGSEPTLDDVRITLSGTDVEVTVSNLKFTGDSYINANNAKSLTVKGCKANVTPSKAGGNSRSAFIVTGTSETNPPLKLVVTGNEIIASKGNNTNGDPFAAAVFGWGYLADGTTISNNTFGSENARYNFVAVKTMNTVEGATFTFEGNTVYGSAADFNFKAFDLYQHCSDDRTYTVVSKNNVININPTTNGQYYSCAFYIEGLGETHVILMDNGSTVNGDPVTLEDVKVSEARVDDYDKFYGVGVTVDENGKITGGTFKQDVDKYTADGFAAVKDGDSYVIKTETKSDVTPDSKAIDNKEVLTNNGFKVEEADGDVTYSHRADTFKLNGVKGIVRADYGLFKVDFDTVNVEAVADVTFGVLLYNIPSNATGIAETPTISVIE